MGLCQPTRQDKNRSPKAQQAHDAASTTRIEEQNVSPTLPPTIPKTNQSPSPRRKAQTAMDQCTTPDKINSREGTELRNSESVISRQQHKRQLAESSQIHNIEHVPTTIDLNLKGPSQINEGVVGRWNQTTYSPKQLFIHIDYDNIFSIK